MREERNRYGQVKSESPQYWLDVSAIHKRYSLKRDYKECGCFVDDDCDCDEDLDDEGWFDDELEASLFTPSKPNRRLLLTLRR